MSFPPYPECKDSGVEWLGEVPSHWGAVPLWTLFRRTKRTGFPEEELLSVYRDYGVIPKASRDDNFNNVSENLALYQLVEPGCLAVNKMKAWQGSVGISRYRGIVSPAYFIYEPLHEYSSEYLHYLLRSLEYAAAYMMVSKGIRVNQWDLDPQYHSRLPVLCPPKEEQSTIVAFLDRETAKIDALVAEQEKLIELLKEKRQAVISHAVTMCNGKWTKLGYHLDLLAGYAFPGEGFSDDSDDIRLLRGINVAVGRVRWDETVYWPHEAGVVLDRYWLEEGDLVFGLDRPWIGSGIRVAEISADDVPSLLLQRVARLRPQNGLRPEFLKLLLMSKAFFSHFEPELTGVSVPHISPDQILSYHFCLPSEANQMGVANEATTALENMERTEIEAQRAIDLLKEHRSALISAAVTGKIDVRDLVSSQEAA